MQPANPTKIFKMKSWNTRLAISALLGGALPGLVLAQQIPPAAIAEIMAAQQGGTTIAAPAPMPAKSAPVPVAEVVTLASFGGLPVFGSHLFSANAARYI